MLKKLVNLSPLLAAAFAVLSLWAANAQRLGFSEVLPPLLVAFILALLFMLLFWLSKFTAKYMPFLATVFTLGCLLWYIGGTSLYYILVIMVGALFLVLNKRGNFAAGVLQSAIPILLAVASIASLIAGFVIQGAGTLVGAIPYAPLVEGQRNVYFIVPDRMPSPEAWRMAGIGDTFDFVKTLREWGFYVPDRQLSQDPYTPTYKDKVYTTRTMRFFASVLNRGAEVPIDISYADCRSQIRDNRVFKDFALKGYVTYNVASWFAETKDMPLAMVNWKYDGVGVIEKFFQSELATAFYNRTIFRGLNYRWWEAKFSDGSIDRNRHLWQRGMVTGLATNPDSSLFIMAHIMLPHEPFVWDWNGTPQTGDGTKPAKYYAQIEFTKLYLLDLVKIIRKYDPNGVIIIQSDEGMAYAEPVELNYSLKPEQWNGVLSAWYIPWATEDQLKELKHTEILDFVLNH